MELRVGYTTGACAAAATNAAGIYMVEGYLPEEVSILLPNGEVVTFSISAGSICGERFIATVIKDAGDDPDVTNGIQISSSIRKSYLQGIQFRAGDGVGTVHRPGLQLEVGEAAINPVPRQMIVSELNKLGLSNLEVEISAKDGVLIAEKTFNQRLGIEGGISIIGTTGIVRPYNRDAVQKTIELNINVVEASGTHELILVPGNLGAKAAVTLGYKSEIIVEVGNEWEVALKRTLLGRFSKVALVGHPGKLAKFISKEFYTRSRESAPAVEIVSRIAAEIGIHCSDHQTVEGIFMELTLSDRRILGDQIALRALQAAQEHFNLSLQMRLILTSMQGGVLGEAYV